MFKKTSTTGPAAGAVSEIAEHLANMKSCKDSRRSNQIREGLFFFLVCEENLGKVGFSKF